MQNSTVVNLYQIQNSFLLDAMDDIVVKLMRKGLSDKLKTILVCGSDPGVGTTTVTINLAISLSQGKWKTLMIDSDMRKKSWQKHLGKEKMEGFSDCLAGDVALDSVIYPTNYPGLSYIPCGTLAESSLRLLSSHVFRDMMESVQHNFDIVVFDSPSLQAANDAVALSLVTDGVLVVAEPNRTYKQNMQKIVDTLGPEIILGVVVNKVEEHEFRSYMSQFDYFSKEKFLKKGRAKGSHGTVASSANTTEKQNRADKDG